MTWCRHCLASAETVTSPNGDGGGREIRSSKSRFTSCSSCGRVLKDSSSLIDDEALVTIHDIATAALGLSTTDSVVLTDAHRLFRTALINDQGRLFSRGRRSRTHTAAACLYISLRQHRNPFMLVDLSDHLNASVYALGAVFVALSRVLSLGSSSLVIVDPSLFMHRISTRLLRREDAEVASTALRILSKVTRGSSRDWMLLRRRRRRHKNQMQILIRLCCAALHIALIAHEVDKSSGSQVIDAVRAEFDNLSCDGGLSVEEFVSRAADVGNDPPSKYAALGGDELVCRHKSCGRAHFRHGLCRECYGIFLEISGGLEESEFRNAKKKTAKLQRKEMITSQSCGSGRAHLEKCNVSSYLNTEKEKQYKTMIWELMNKDYLEDQLARIGSAVAAALDARTGDASRPRKERKRSQAHGAAGAEAAKEAPKKKQLSSRINYEVLSHLNQVEQQPKPQTRADAADDKWRKESNEELDAEDGDNCDEDGNPAEVEHDDYFGDVEEDDVEGDYNEHFADGGEEYAYEELGF